MAKKHVPSAEGWAVFGEDWVEPPVATRAEAIELATKILEDDVDFVYVAKIYGVATRGDRPMIWDWMEGTS